MPETTEAVSPNRIPAATVRRWAMRAFVLGLAAGFVVALAALLS